MTLSEFIEKISTTKGFLVDIVYAHPTLYIFCLADKFAQISEEARCKIFSDLVGVSKINIEAAIHSPLIELLLLTNEERIDDYSYLMGGNSETSWLSAFRPHLVSSKKNNNEIKDTIIEIDAHTSVMRAARAIHFYGYKGGQGRSTVLLSLAKTLADAGFRVLIVDADIEAPSLDSMLNVAAPAVESTIMGLIEPGSLINPLSRTYVGTPVSGYIDLMPARPVAARFDMDFAAFLLNVSLDTSVLQLAISNLRKQVECVTTDGQPLYDVVLFDHRTGIAPSILPIMKAWPGPAVVFVRPDGMARHIQDSRLLDTLLSYDSESPGAFVSFSLDPKKTPKESRSEHAKFIESLLGKIADAMEIDEADDLPDLEPYWVFWRHDQNLVDGQQPSPKDMSSGNRDAIAQLRSVLGLSGNPTLPAKEITLTSSGSSDEGQFILTPGLAKLFSFDSPYTYVFGRKGTGKTRLLTELVSRDMAEPLLVAHDSSAGGIRSGGVTFNYALTACGRDFEEFWWLLLRTALSQPTTKGDGSLDEPIKAQVGILSASANVVHPSAMQADTEQKRRVFVIDGVETAVPASELRRFVEALFRFLAAVQYDSSLSKTVSIRLLLRTDLATGAAQNVEQQIEGSVLYLHWNKTAILNFALGRIKSLKWFKDNFKGACAKIEDRTNSISRGSLPDDEAEALLLEIFPRGLERNRLKTTTFFASYFSDAGGAIASDAAFYPRLFDGFLRTLAENCSENKPGTLLDNRLSSITVLQAYDQASQSFINEVRTELYSFLDLDPETDRNNVAVDTLIASFTGLQTPFSVEDIIVALVRRTKIPEDTIRQSLTSMQKIGMFEIRPGYPGELRARQLYKAGLGMKYVRKSSNVGTEH